MTKEYLFYYRWLGLTYEMCLVYDGAFYVTAAGIARRIPTERRPSRVDGFLETRELYR